MSWFGFAEEEEEDPNRKLLVIERMFSIFSGSLNNIYLIAC